MVDNGHLRAKLYRLSSRSICTFVILNCANHIEYVLLFYSESLLNAIYCLDQGLSGRNRAYYIVYDILTIFHRPPPPAFVQTGGLKKCEQPTQMENNKYGVGVIKFVP